MKILKILTKFFDNGIVYAHCDIPCGIYTTHQAAVAAETVEKMVEKIQGTSEAHDIARFTATKEQWAEICKKELLILWTDYFKEEHLEAFPNLHSIFWTATKLCSKNKREVNPQSAKQLRRAVQEVSEMFEKTEGTQAATYRKEWL